MAGFLVLLSYQECMIELKARNLLQVQLSIYADTNKVTDMRHATKYMKYIFII